MRTPESNGWPAHAPLRAWVPAVNACNVEVGDWIRHSGIRDVRYASHFQMVEQVIKMNPINGSTGWVKFLLVPRRDLPMGDQYQRRVALLHPLALVEIRLMFPAAVEQVPTPQLTTGD